MKPLLILGLAILGLVIGFRPTRFEFLNFTSKQFDISWDEITEDLWP